MIAPRRPTESRPRPTTTVKAKAKAKDLSHKAKAKDLGPKAKANYLSPKVKAKDLDFGRKDQGQRQGLTSLISLRQSIKRQNHIDVILTSGPALTFHARLSLLLAAPKSGRRV